jgi:hypothetical protein
VDPFEGEFLDTPALSIDSTTETMDLIKAPAVFLIRCMTMVPATMCGWILVEPDQESTIREELGWATHKW